METANLDKTILRDPVTFVQDPTTTSDHGIYRVDLIDDTTPTPVVLETQEFIVTPPSEFNH